MGSGIRKVFPQLNIAEKIAVFSVAAGATSTVIAFFSSLRARRATQISLEALELSKEALELSKRALSIAVKSVRGDDCLILSPVGSEQEINNLTIYFPRKLGLEPIPLVSGNLKLLDVRITSALRSYWDSHTPESPGNAILRSNIPVPVVIDVHGHTRGAATVTKGIYDLYMQYVRSGGRPSLQVQALTLNNYAFHDDDPQNLADQLLEHVETADRQVNIKKIT
jgi:hypothetical protein